MRFLSLVVFVALVCFSPPSISLFLSGLLLVTRDPWAFFPPRALLALCLLPMVVIWGPISHLFPPPISPSTPLLRLPQLPLLLRVSSKSSNPSLHSLRPPRKPYLSLILVLVVVPVIAVVTDSFHLTLISKCSYSFLSSLCVSIQPRMF